MAVWVDVWLCGWMCGYVVHVWLTVPSLVVDGFVLKVREEVVDHFEPVNGTQNNDL